MFCVIVAPTSLTALDVWRNMPYFSNIGTSSMPSFINQVIFHQVALSKEKIPLSKRFINPHRSGLNKAMTKAGLL